MRGRPARGESSMGRRGRAGPNSVEVLLRARCAAEPESTSRVEGARTSTCGVWSARREPRPALLGDAPPPAIADTDREVLVGRARQRRDEPIVDGADSEAWAFVREPVFARACNRLVE